MAQNTKTPVMVLQELMIKRGYAPPEYKVVFQISGTHENRFDFVVSAAGIEAKGSGSSKQIGKHQAAHNALQKLQEIGIYNHSENPVTAFNVPLQDEHSSYKSALNCIVELQNICMENKLPAPEYIEISSVGPPHNKEFTFGCKVSHITTEAKASTKKMARHLASKEMLERIKDTIPDLVCEQKDLHKKLVEKESEAIVKYQETREIIPDKSIEIGDMPNTLAKLMSFKELKYEDFQQDLRVPSEESLKKILEKLDVNYQLSQFQESPPMAILTLKIDTPFTLLSTGGSIDDAKWRVLNQTFLAMDQFMQIRI